MNCLDWLPLMFLELSQDLADGDFTLLLGDWNLHKLAVLNVAELSRAL